MPSDRVPLQRFVGQLSGFSDPDKTMAFSITELHRLLGADFSTWSEIHAADRTVMRAFVDPPVGNRAFGFMGALRTHLGDHPVFFERADAREFPDVVLLSDIVPWERFRETGLYREVYRHLESRYQIGLELGRPGGVVRYLAFNRWRSDFGERERVILQAVRAPLQAAVCRTHAAIDLEYVLRAMMCEGADGRGVACIQLREDLSFSELSPAASALLERYGRQPGTGQELPSMLLGWLREQVDGGLIDRDDRTFIHRRLCQTVMSDGDGRLVVTLVKTDGTLYLHLRESRELERLQHRAWSRLTPRKHEILRWVAEGKTNEEIAMIVGISTKGVEKHVSELCRRFEVNNRIGLVREFYCR